MGVAGFAESELGQIPSCTARELRGFPVTKESADQQASGRTIRDLCRKRQLTEPFTPTAFVPITLIPTPSMAAIEVRYPSGPAGCVPAAGRSDRSRVPVLFRSNARGRKGLRSSVVA